MSAGHVNAGLVETMRTADSLRHEQIDAFPGRIRLSERRPSGEWRSVFLQQFASKKGRF